MGEALIDRLFVYGTLRRGSPHEHAKFLAQNARYMGCAAVQGRLYRVADYPGLGPSQSNNDWVHGDVYEGLTADLFRRLDDYEGSAYVRELAEVALEDDRRRAAYVYRYALPPDGLERIQSGDWITFSSRSAPPE